MRLNKEYMGTISLSPDKDVIAGEFSTWTITFTAGEYGIDDGGTMVVAWKSVSDWDSPQFDEPAMPGYTTVSTTGDCRVSARYSKFVRSFGNSILIDVNGGYIKKGDQIRIVLGDTSQGSLGMRAQSFCEREHEFRIFLDPCGTARYEEMPERLKVRIVPSFHHEIQAIVPGTVTVGEPFDIAIRALDEFGNPTGLYGGRISLNTTNGSLTFPGIFEHPTIEAGALTGDVYWTRQNGQPIVTFERIHVVNADADVSAQGTWRADPAAGPAGVADITGTIARAQAASVWKYMPLVIGKPVRDWLQNGLVSGTAQNGTFEIRGPFKGFPWVKDPKSGRFYVGADVVNAAIDYVPDRVSKKKGALWPLLTDINGRIAFEGLSMRVEADRAKTFGVDVGKTTAVIANLAGGSSTLLDSLSEKAGHFTNLGEALSRGVSGREYVDAEFRDYKPQHLANSFVAFSCPCSRKGFEDYLANLPQKEKDEILSGTFPLNLECFNCGTIYSFTESETETLFKKEKTDDILCTDSSEPE